MKWILFVILGQDAAEQNRKDCMLSGHIWLEVNICPSTDAVDPTHQHTGQLLPHETATSASPREGAHSDAPVL